jgi:hypothetical protein
VLLAGFVLLLTNTPSWGQTPTCAHPGCNPTASDANGNTAGGTNALLEVGSFGPVSSNTAFGDGALGVNKTGNLNTATGSQALSGNLAGGFNTASGANALLSNNGDSNTASGYDALVLNTTGSNNTASGANALYSNTTGNLNTANGFQALESNDAGNNNTAIGAKALKKSLGTKNIAIGFEAGVSLVNGNNNIYIGNQGAGDESQTIRIGTAQAQTFIAGINTASVSDATVMIDTTTGQLGIATSSARYKQDIAPLGTGSDGVLQLRPATFAYKDDARHVKHYGLVAEEVERVFPELVTHTPTGEVQHVAAHLGRPTAQSALTVLATNNANAPGFIRVFLGCAEQVRQTTTFRQYRGGNPSELNSSTVKGLR